MPKSDTIEAILSLNPTAKPDFLAEFSNEDLHEYLRRLTFRPSESARRNDHRTPSGEDFEEKRRYPWGYSRSTALRNGHRNAGTQPA